MEEKKEELKSVQIGNFVYTLSGDGVISVATSSGTWYVGYVPGSMAHSLIYMLVFSNESISEEDEQTVSNFITSVYCVCNIVDAEFTTQIFSNIDAFMKRNADKNVDINSKEQQKENEDALEKLQAMSNMEEHIANIE